MKSIARNSPINRSARAARGVARSLLSDVGWLLGRMRIYLETHRKAQAATHLHAVLSRMSDRDLARLGLKRDGIAAYIRDRLG